MLRGSMASPLLAFDSPTRLKFLVPDLVTIAPDIPHMSRTSRSKWVIRSTAPTINTALTDEDMKNWEACREALSASDFSIEEKDKMLGKAFGHIQSPYWSEERKQQVPTLETISKVLDYLRGLGLADDDLYKLLKKFPEVLGCSLENELKNNVMILEKDWGIEGNSLRKLLMRNPKVLGYNVDCKGDCMAKCTRCWVRF